MLSSQQECKIVFGSTTLLASFGSIGLGFVWGWFLIFFRQAQRPLTTAISLVLATLLLSLLPLWFSGQSALIYFWAAVIFSFIMHIAWRQSLRSNL